MSTGAYRSYTPVAPRIAGWACEAVLAGLVTWLAVGDAARWDWTGATTALTTGCVAGAVTGELLLRPVLRTTPVGVVLVNPLSTVTVPWAAVRGYEPACR